MAKVPAKVYIVEPIGQVEDDPDRTEQKSKGIPSMACRSREPLRVVGECCEAWPALSRHPG